MLLHLWFPLHFEFNLLLHFLQSAIFKSNKFAYPFPVSLHFLLSLESKLQNSRHRRSVLEPLLFRPYHQLFKKIKKTRQAQEFFAEESVKVLKNAAKTRKFPAKEDLSASKRRNSIPRIFLKHSEETNHREELRCSCLPQKQKGLDSLQKGLERGKYFTITAIQRFDAAGKRIENGVYLGPLKCLTFEDRISWKKRILAFVFKRIRIKIGPLNPFESSFKGKDEREPNTMDPFFTRFYVDGEIAVARGRSGGTAFWVRRKRVRTY